MVLTLHLQLVVMAGPVTFLQEFLPYRQHHFSATLVPNLWNMDAQYYVCLGFTDMNVKLTILVCISFVLVIAVYVIYWKGPVLRKRSPFAQQLEGDRAGLHERRQSVAASRGNSLAPGVNPSRGNSMAAGKQARPADQEIEKV